MEIKTGFKIIKNFISNNEKNVIIDFVNSIKIDQKIENKHIINIAKNLNGNSYMFDMSKSDISSKLASYQSSKNICDIQLPEIFHHIADRIGIDKSNLFLQIIDMNRGGIIKPHYDSSVSGFVNYKCNVSILSDDYNITIGENSYNISEGDLYCFEASLYKHYTRKEFNNRRILLSYAFIVKYEYLGWSINDPIVRMSERIQKYFQNEN